MGDTKLPPLPDDYAPGSPAGRAMTEYGWACYLAAIDDAAATWDKVIRTAQRWELHDNILRRYNEAIRGLGDGLRGPSAR